MGRVRAGARETQPERGPVAVVIPAYNARHLLPACLAALRCQTRAPDAVYVVDNGSADGTWEWLREEALRDPRLRPLRELTPGQAAARNAALSHVRAGVVAFTDADCVPEPAWLERLLGAYGERVGAVAGYVAGHAPRTVTERYLSVAGFPTPDVPGVLSEFRFPTVVFYTANFSARAEVLHALGGFDEAMPPADDHDLCCRILRAGWRIAYTPEARVGHRHRRQVGAMLRRLFEYGHARPKMLRKNCAGTAYLLVGARVVEWRGGVTACVNLSSPDKVSLALLGLSLWSPWWLGVLGAYWIRTGAHVLRAARRRGVLPRSPWELAAWTGLHLLEFGAVNAGSLAASPRHRVLCV